jgi:hypothetical protein
MKKKIITAILAVSCVGFFVGTASAATFCPTVSVLKTGTTISGSLFVRIKNVGGAACGGLAVNTTSDLTFDGDQNLAVLLTALSLGKNVGVNTLGTAVTGDVLASVIVTQ